MNRTSSKALLGGIRHASSSAVPAAKGRVGDVADPKRDIIRRVLYPANIRNKASPTGTWRTDVAWALKRAVPSVQAHDTIERAWLLYQRRLREQRQAELTRKFECMHHAMDVLHEIDPHLYQEANVQEDPRKRSVAEVELGKTLKGSAQKVLDSRIRGLFPREIRIPTETPSREGWNYEFTPMVHKKPCE
jgi:large subunit ribosomal protein L40